MVSRPGHATMGELVWLPPSGELVVLHDGDVPAAPLVSASNVDSMDAGDPDLKVV
ncbi:MAG: hypothetical protein QM714_03495 [Nocardioides sp.]|uniref:hypothetical protein n=1 Tax=Nocardioides sp. TaxID=35761 RepID=UPI0039E5C4DC